MSDDKPRRPPTNRDLFVSKRTPSRGVPNEVAPWQEESTGVHTDPQVFRALKGLRDEIADNRNEAARAHGALKGEVSALVKRFDSFEQRVDGKLDDVLTQSSTVVGQVSVLLADRRVKSPSSETRTVVTETLAVQVLNEQRDAAKFKRALMLKIAGGVFTSAVLGAIVSYFLGR